MLRFLPLALLAGCVSVRSAPPDAGAFGLYRASMDTVRLSALAALRDSNFAVSEQKPILATGYDASGATLVARVLIEPKGSDCAVRVHVAGPNSDAVAKAIHERLATKLNLPAPPPPLPPPAATNDGIERVFRSLLTICFDAAVRVCRDRDYRIREDKRVADHTGAVAGEGKGFALSIQLHRRSDNLTRVILHVRGRSTAENRDEAMRLLDKLKEELREP